MPTCQSIALHHPELLVQVYQMLKNLLNKERKKLRRICMNTRKPRNTRKLRTFGRILWRSFECHHSRSSYQEHTSVDFYLVGAGSLEWAITRASNSRALYCSTLTNFIRVSSYTTERSGTSIRVSCTRVASECDVTFGRYRTLWSFILLQKHKA